MFDCSAVPASIDDGHQKHWVMVGPSDLELVASTVVPILVALDNSASSFARTNDVLLENPVLHWLESLVFQLEVADSWTDLHGQTYSEIVADLPRAL